MKEEAKRSIVMSISIESMLQNRLLKKVLTAALAVLLISAFTAVASAATIYVPEGGNQTIQQAVNNATAGDIIIVRDGTYTVNVDVNVAHLTIKSENGSASTIVQAANSCDHVFEVTANNVTISGFTVTGATDNWMVGIYLINVDHCNISNNIANSNNWAGIRLQSSSNNTIANNTVNSNGDMGISLHSSSSNNRIENNTAINNTHGIMLRESSSNNKITDNNASLSHTFGIRIGCNSQNNTITGNTASSNGDTGISLHESAYNNTLSGNIANENNHDGINLDSSSNNSLQNNTANSNGDHGIGLYSSSNYNTLANNTANENNHDGIKLVSSSNNSLQNNIANENIGVGIRLDSSSNNSLQNNIAYSNGDAGIRLESLSNNNMLQKNTANSNNWFGILLCDSSNNSLTNNTASNNVYGKGIILYSSSNNSLTNNTASNNTDWDFYSNANSHNNTVKDLTIASYPTTVSFTYDNGIKMKGVDTAPGDPGGNVNISKYVNATEVTANSWLFLNVSYNNSDIAGVEESTLRLWKNNGSWYEVEGSGVNEAENYVYANITEFSIFAPLGNPSGGLNCTCGDICVNTTGWWRDGDAFQISLEPVWAAVNSSAVGETICVKDGTYTENVNVTKSHLTIQSENGYASTIVQAASSNEHVFNVTRDYVNISGFTVKGATSYPGVGINLINADHCNISDNNASNNYNGGIYLQSSNNNNITNNIANSNDNPGIYLWYSNNNDITNNNASDNGYLAGICLGSSTHNNLMNNTANSNVGSGIYLSRSSNSTLTNNTANSNVGSGIYLSRSSNSTLTNNTANSNKQYGIRLTVSSNSTLINNTAKENSYFDLYVSAGSDSQCNNTIENMMGSGDRPIKYYNSSVDLSDVTLSELILCNADHSNISNVTIEGSSTKKNNGVLLVRTDFSNLTNIKSSNNYDGIHLSYSSNNTLTNNTASDNRNCGINLQSATHSNLTCNIASDNSGCGICLRSSSNNTLTNNTANENKRHGIHLSTGGDYNNLTNNTVNSNSGDGIFLEERNNNNNITGNTILNNTDYGIHIYYDHDNSVVSNGNLIYNNYFNNTNNAYDYYRNNNIWNITKTAGTNIIGGSWLGGNYWSDYDGSDENGDGLGDTKTPYNSSGNIQTGGDYLPLTAVLDITPPASVSDLNETDTGTTWIQWNWTNPFDADFNHTEVWIEGEFKENVTAPEHTYNATGLNSGTTYEIGTRTVDDSGNVNQTWVNDTATTISEAPGLNCTCGDICANTTGWWRDGGIFNASNTPIQHAVNNATAGNTICVKDGTYTENVDVNMGHLTVKSQNGSASTIVQAASSNDHVFEVKEDYVNISGFNVTGATGAHRAGICLGSGVTHCNISDNMASNNTFGIHLWESSTNTLRNNTACENYDSGIQLSYYSSYNSLSDNTACDNGGSGIGLWNHSSYNMLSDNNASDNEIGVQLSLLSNNNTLQNNTAFNNTISDEDGIGISIGGSSYNDIECGNVYYNDIGISIESGMPGSYNNVTGVNVTDNDIGIELMGENNCTIANNVIRNNTEKGIFLEESSNNTLHNNNASDNGHGIYLLWSNDNVITDNIVLNNLGVDSGIHLNVSHRNNISSNTITGNDRGIYMHSSCYNKITDNNVSYNNVNGVELGPFTSSSYNTISNNIIDHNGLYGIYFHYYEAHNNIFNNTISNNTRGIFIDNADNNNITDNVIVNNQQYGIYLNSSNSNTIYNNYFNNTNNNAWDDGTNVWNVTKRAGTSIIGGPYLGGNYWSDYAGNDSTGDGLGDNLLPYNSSGNITNGGDWHPLVPVKLCGDVAPYPDCDGIVDMGDVILLLNHVGYPGNSTYALCNDWSGDCRCNGIINMGDVILLLNNVSYPGESKYVLDCCG